MSIFNPNPQPDPQSEAKESPKRTWAFRLLAMMLILMIMLLISPQPSEAQEPNEDSNRSIPIQELEDGRYIVEGRILVKAEAGFQVGQNLADYQWQEIKRIDLSPNSSNQSNQEVILYKISSTRKKPDLPKTLDEYNQLTSELLDNNNVECAGMDDVIGSPNSGFSGFSGSLPVILPTSINTKDYNYFNNQWAFNQFQNFRSRYDGLNVEIAVFDGFRNHAAKHWQGEEKIDFDAFSEVTPISLTPDVANQDISKHGEMIISQIHYLAPVATILPVRVLNEHLLGDTMTLIEGLDKVIKRNKSNNASNLNRKMIVNMSLGLNASPNSDRCDIKIINELLNTANTEGIIVIAAAGNEANDKNESNPSLIEGYKFRNEIQGDPPSTQTIGNPRPGSQYPANHDTVIGVAATDSANQLAYYSNKGNVSAPGGEIRGCNDDKDCQKVHGIIGKIPTSSGYEYIAWEGTSFAAPFVSGLVAKFLYCNMDLGPDQVRDAIDFDPNIANNRIDIEYISNLCSE